MNPGLFPFPECPDLLGSNHEALRPKGSAPLFYGFSERSASDSATLGGKRFVLEPRISLLMKRFAEERFLGPKRLALMVQKEALPAEWVFQSQALGPGFL